MNWKYGANIALLCSLLAFTAACGGSKMTTLPRIDPLLLKSPQKTGARQPDTDIPYTAATPNSPVNAMKGEDQTSNGDVQLSKFLKDFSLQFSTSTPLQKTFEITLKWAAQSAGTQKISLQLPDSIVLQGSLKPDASGQFVGETGVDAKSGLQVFLECTDSNCSSVTGRVKLKEFQVSFIQKKQNAWATVKGNTSTLAALDTGKVVKSWDSFAVTTVAKEVSLGFSKLSVTFPFPLCLSGDVIETKDIENPFHVSCLANSGLTPPLNIRMVGNTESGNWIFKTESHGSPTYIEIKTDSTLIQNVPPALPPIHTGIINVGGLTLDFENPITRIFEYDLLVRDTRGLTKNRIQYWLKNHQSRLQKYLTYLPPRLPEMLPAFDHAGVPHEFMLVTLWESNYFLSPDYEISIGGKGEVGPWQFMKATAGDYNLRTFNATLTPKYYSECDERAHLAPSTEAAATYWARLLKKFPSDPHLAILGYNWGPGNAVKALEKCRSTQSNGTKVCAKDDGTKFLQDVKNAGYDFWSIVEYKMAPQTSVDYVLNLLSAIHIFTDHQKYGFKVAAAATARMADPHAALCKMKLTPR